MREHLEALHKRGQSVTTMTYEAAMQRASLAQSFIAHPYWDIVAKMLSGTIQAETEELLSEDTHREINRASVAICRKVLRMPHFDIEQGRMAEGEYQNVLARSLRRTYRSANAQEENYSGKH